MEPGSDRRWGGTGRAVPRHQRASASKVALAAALAAALLAIGGPSARAERGDFPRPASLEPAVGFWTRIFATYSEHQVVVHDAWYLGKVYEVLDFRPWFADGEPATSEVEALRAAKIDEAKMRVSAILLRLHEGGSAAQGLTAEEQRIQALFRDVPGDDRYLAAAERIRTQAGLRERFAAGIAQQGRYLERMERIFATRGMPTELARLPLVESCFDVEAYSKVGAAGVWQFMPRTGRQYMRIDAAVDERRDPVRATEAAAEHLQGDYEALGAWPLAITAYNHGRGGVARGVAETGSTNIGEIVARYRGRAFGFASRNFYAEFLAALDVTSRAQEHYGAIPVLPPLEAIEVEVPRPVHLAEVARRVGVQRDDVVELNPALLPVVTRGGAPIPRGYVLRLPRSAGSGEAEIASALAAMGREQPERRLAVRAATSGRKTQVAGSRAKSSGKDAAKAQAAAATASKKPTQAVRVAKQGELTVHHVAPGQTLADIARRYGTTVALIQGLNNLRQPKALQAGQKLRVPRNT